MNNLEIQNKQLAYACIDRLGGEAEGYEVRKLSGIEEDPRINYNGLNTQIALRGLEKEGIIHRTKRNTRQVTWFITKKKRII